jgi:hypothetical protein
MPSLIQARIICVGIHPSFQSRDFINWPRLLTETMDRCQYDAPWKIVLSLTCLASAAVLENSKVVLGILTSVCRPFIVHYILLLRTGSNILVMCRYVSNNKMTY